MFVYLCTKIALTMKFRTEIEVAPWREPIDYDHKITCLGSCFASNIATRLARRKFNVVSSPTGILFNPVSIANAVDMMVACYEGGEGVDERMMVQHEGRYLNYDFHSQLSALTVEDAAELMRRQLVEGGHRILSSDLVIITLGTAWCYTHRATGRVVANCHKQPSSLFERRLLSVSEVVDALRMVVEMLNCRVLFTISPIRHVGEGLEDNSLSKAILRVAVAEVCSSCNGGVDYFPAYEIMMDDLRDYRFYESDMTHPTQQAVDYIADKFFDAALSAAAKQTMQQVDRIISAVEHRPFNPASEGYKIFCRKQLEAIESIKGVDLSKESAFLERMLAENV